jgi:DNA-binding MarR family transcriptional regulator
MGCHRAAPGDRQEQEQLMTQPSALTGQDIAEAFGAVQGLQEQALAGTGSTALEHVALRVLAGGGPFEAPASLHELLARQRQLALSTAAAGELLARLEARGLATGTAKDGPGPARLTPAGTEELRRLNEAIAPTVRDLYSGMDAADLATAHRVLRQVIDRAGLLRAEHAN